ncbi:hypothetical protein ABH961_005681 [Bacillus sp. RC251]|uniref:hypothetical protein n=1 Tax=Bacillus sp. RC251 TaxID=3156290 RepID=UPI0038397381
MARKRREIEIKVINDEEVPGIDCGKCKQWKPLTNFGKNKRTPSGFKNCCKKCDAEDSKKYRNRNVEHVKDYNRRYYAANKEKFMELQRKSRRENKAKHNSYKQIRRARKNALPDTLTPEQIEKITTYFNGACALTGSTDYELDHFIAITTGHGGTTFKNMIPLSRTLNASKNNKNPFEWFEDNKCRFKLDDNKFFSLIDYLANINGMSMKEFRDYVYKCYSDSQLQKVN